MADIALVTANRVTVVKSIEQMTLPAGEAIVAGAPVRIDGTTGKFVNSNAATLAASRIYGVAVRTVAAGEAVTAIRYGIFDGFDLSGLAYDANVYLSNTAGRLADAIGTITSIIGKVIPTWGVTTGTAADKLMLVDASGGGGGGGAIVAEQEVIITATLLAASVDTQIFVADRAYEVVAIREIHSVVGGAAAAVRPRKITDTSAPGAAAGATVKELTTANVDLTAAINTVVSPALVAVAADLLLAAGNVIALDFSGTLTGLVGMIEIVLEPR